MAEADKLNIDSIIQRLLEGKVVYSFCSFVGFFGSLSVAKLATPPPGCFIFLTYYTRKWN